MSAVSLCLDATTDKLEAFLGGAGTPRVMVIYHSIPSQVKPDFSEYKRAKVSTVLAGATETTILSAPPQGEVYHIDAIYLNNDTGGTVTATIVIDTSGTNDILVEQQLLDTETLSFTAGEGFRVM